MEELDAIMAHATAAVAPDYFLLPIFGGNPVSRERVYCYELYHQMRQLWPADAHHVLNGEVDKRAHAAMAARGVRDEKPDFLVHHPGIMDDNHAIIEVKSIKASAKGLRKDLKTLKLFRQGPGYDRGIFLFYGGGNLERLLARVNKAANQVEGCGGIEVWHHAVPGVPAEQMATL